MTPMDSSEEARRRAGCARSAARRAARFRSTTPGSSRILDLDAVVEDLDPDVVAVVAVRAVEDGIHDTLEPPALRDEATEPKRPSSRRAVLVGTCMQMQIIAVPAGRRDPGRQF